MLAGIILLLFMLIAFALPGNVPTGASFPRHPLFGISQAAHEPERLAGPDRRDLASDLQPAAVPVHAGPAGVQR